MDENLDVSSSVVPTEEGAGEVALIGEECEEVLAENSPKYSKKGPKHARSKGDRLQGGPLNAPYDRPIHSHVKKLVEEVGWGAESAKSAKPNESAAPLISACVILSRITGFARTWAMAYALGATFLASSYQVANNLPNMLYELVMGGLLVTAFLPVYVSIKEKLGGEEGNRYASNLLTLVVLILGVVSVLGIIFPQVIVYTQSFYSDQQTMGSAILLFQFFAIQAVFYGGSTIFSGLLNANREYLWSSLAPVFNNLVVIATFVAYAVVAPSNPDAALYIIAIGNPLGVFLQMAIQIPALRKCGIVLRPRIDLRDPAIKETVSLGVPAFLITIFSFITVSVMNAASYAFADNGPSVLVYARLWYTLPYSFLAIPITTELFTELSHMHTKGDIQGIVKAVSSGTSQIMFLLIPFAMYLMVFSFELVTIYHIGAFSMDDVAQIASYLSVLAIALPFYGVNTYMQKVFSSVRKLAVFAVMISVGGIVQVALTMGGVALADAGYPVTIESVAIASAAFYLVSDAAALIYLKRFLGSIGGARIVRATLLGCLLGAIGAAGGWGVFWLLETFVSPITGSIWQSLAYVIIGGVVALAFTFGIAAKFRISEAELILTMVRKVGRRFVRHR